MDQAGSTEAREALLAQLGLTRSELVGDLGVPPPEALADEPKLHDLSEILASVVPWAGSMPRGYAWFSSQPLPSFSNQTAAELVRQGRADAVKAHIERIAVGGYT